MKYQVFITGDAEKDILYLYDYILSSDCTESADYVYKNIKANTLGLSDFPSKRHYPPELERIGITEYREIHFKLYRIIFQIIGVKVFVHCVFDGRRDLQEILERRLLR
ncbi:type II toxin-antitoxin system RelE/ParE family toxin [Spirochaeta isovalerica]|uniref:Toxin ParE1/3/4 n=1 Tax=Spirochaeta isovalerica TaxID=150 RepID=A0A841RD47_9SPIO|nr:type II toxin-antitoxin system RelE/ParE family toxin [Spirochaeta isovalerica]MBB6481157.1 toxin ParE1/3/4 [Spirochaeta isovalerica]